MNSLVNYGSSDSENEITDEEEDVTTGITKQNGENKQEYDNLSNSVSLIKLPPSSRAASNQIIEEEEDEFLHKKEVPASKPPPAPKPREKVKITIPKLSDFKDDEDDDFSSKKIPTASNKKTGLLGMLPKPSNCIGPAPKPPSVVQKPPPSTVTSIPEKSTQSAPSTSSSSESQPKKIGMIPYALMDHKKLADAKKTTKKKSNESDSEEEEENAAFFTFSSKDDDLPQVSEEEIKLLIEKEKNRIEQRKRQNDGTLDLESDLQEQDASSQYYQQQQQQPDIDKEAISALLGGNKAKRSKYEDIQIVDLSANDVLPDRAEWMRKTLRGETDYIPTGKIDEKGPALAKRKHQLTYLATRAEKNMAELEAMWASNRQNNREARSKYGF